MNDYQLEMALALQLQFMSMSSLSLKYLAKSFFGSHPYRHNEYSDKFQDIITDFCGNWTEDDHNCVACHLALQMAGLE